MSWHSTLAVEANVPWSLRGTGRLGQHTGRAAKPGRDPPTPDSCSGTPMLQEPQALLFLPLFALMCPVVIHAIGMGKKNVLPHGAPAPLPSALGLGGADTVLPQVLPGSCSHASIWFSSRCLAQMLLTCPTLILVSSIPQWMGTGQSANHHTAWTSRPHS